jgi:hypothetical protein
MNTQQLGYLNFFFSFAGNNNIYGSSYGIETQKFTALLFQATGPVDLAIRPASMAPIRYLTAVNYLFIVTLPGHEQYR